jgi:apolipoprotein N-acyltransferase
MRWAAAVLSAGLLELPFPLAAPMPPWRSVFAWFGLAPLIWAVIRTSEDEDRPLRRSFLVAYVCGVLWYMGNCYWIYATMNLHGGLPPVVSALLLVAFSLVLGGYFGLFGLGLAVVRRRLGLGWALAAAPFIWVTTELAGARITSVPWDQLGYSQVDNGFLTALAPWTGVYGISFVLVAINAVCAAILMGRFGFYARGLRPALLRLVCFGGLVVLAGGFSYVARENAPTSATAVLVQPNLDVTADNDWNGPDWDAHIAQFVKLAGEECKTYIAGIPQTGASNGEIQCPPWPTHPDLVAWPEAPAPFIQPDAKFQQAAAQVARSVQAPLVVGGIGTEFAGGEEGWRDYNSAMLFRADGSFQGRYDKIHLVPFGEYIPFKDLLTFAHKLTGRVSSFSRGRDRMVFHIADQKGGLHRYGFLICYEAVFADEVREFARNGAEVLVNISDDGWYGDTSAPWQHLNMARMRAIENRRWLLRDTNNGVTAAIDPYGRVRQSIPRHAVDALPAQYGFRDDVTFYTQHGDVFGWCCAVLAAGFVGLSFRDRVGMRKKIAVWWLAAVMSLGVAASGTLCAGQTSNGASSISGAAANDLWPDVNINTLVLDKQGVPQKIAEQDFHLFEDGTERPLRFQGSQDSPVSLALMIDSSGSVLKHKDAIVSAVKAIVNGMPDGSEVMAVLFTDKAFLDLPFTPVNKVDFSFLDRLQARGPTRLYDAVFATEDHIVAQAKYPRRALVILSDGEDNASHVSRRAAFWKLEQLGAPVVYACRLSKASLLVPNDSAVGRINMKFMGKEGGGADFSLDPDPESTAAQIAKAIRSQYVLRFTTARPARDGKARKITVRLPVKDVQIHALPVYFAPAK